MRMMVMAVSVVVLLTGCVSTQTVPLRQERLAALQGGTITVTNRPKPGFTALTAGKAMFGMIGAAAMIVAGNKIIEENAVEDPAGYIATALATELASANTMTLVPKEGVLARSWKPAELARQYTGSDLLLDIQTVNWSFGYFPSDWNNYRVIYNAKLRLIDTKSGKLLAAGFCSSIPDKSADAPSHDELLADNAARLKQELTEAADHCIIDFRTKVLLSPPASR
ncbi:MAG TPA: hypothetical protein VGF69_06655 [Thermoanaerobaculia bacterium]|jgi:hypothetical protein